MEHVNLIVQATTHQIYGALERWFGRTPHSDVADHDRDRGAVSLEQVLWFVAAGVSVAVVATILWGQIKDKADDPVTTPVAP